MQPLFLAAEMLLPVTGLSDILFLTVLVPVQLSCGVAFIASLCVGLKDYFLFLRITSDTSTCSYTINESIYIVLLCRVIYI